MGKGEGGGDGGGEGGGRITGLPNCDKKLEKMELLPPHAQKKIVS